MKFPSLIVEKTFDSPIEKVWNAFTISEQMKEWYFDIPNFKAELGFKFDFTGGPSPERQYKHLCEILEVVPYHKLSHSWSFAGYEGDSILTIKLFDLGEQTKLQLTHEGIESFSSDNSDFAIENFEVGWGHIINVGLLEYLK